MVVNTKALKTPEKQILPIAPPVEDLGRLTKWAADITRILQDNLPRIARKANEQDFTGNVSVTGNFSVTGTFTYQGADIDTRYVNVTGDTMTGGLVLPAGTTTVHPLNIPHGVAATTPTNGDLWSTTAAFFARINGSTKTFAVLETAQTWTAAQTYSNTITNSVDPATGPQLHTSKVTTLAQNAEIILSNNSGLLVISDRTNGATGLITLGGGSVIVVSAGPGAQYVNTSTPSTSQTGIYFTPNSYRVKHGFAANHDYSMLWLSSRDTV